jgi:Bacterial Ig-like domain (group 3)
MALLPVDFSVQHYTYWWGTPDAPNYPDMGAMTDSNAGNCNTWYYSASAPSTINLVSKSYFSYSDEGPPTKFAFTYEEFSPVTIPSPLDWFVIASSATPAKAGTSSQQITLLDSQVGSTLFSASQLNIPMDAFLDQGGPMASVWWDSATVGFDHFPAKQTCSLYVAGKYGNSTPPNGSLTGSAPNAVRVTLKIPTFGVLGDNIVLKATAVVANASLTSGTIAFSDGDTELGRSALDSTGTAAFTINTLALGVHTISASFVATTQYTATNPVKAPLVIYSNDADLTLSLSTASLTVTSGATSSPLSLQVTSKWGLAGPVMFSCSGLPAGATCTFAPSQVTLTDGMSGTTSLTITSVKQTAKLDRSAGVFAAMFLPLPLLLLRRRYRRSIQLLCAIVIVSVGSPGILTGCSSSPSAPVKQPTASTILVTATSGTISRSIPISVTVQ